MAYSNFKPTVWSKFIQRELEKKCKLVQNCWSQFEGEAKLGKEVKILGVGSPTIGTYDGTSIGSPENVEDTSVMLQINQAKFFNFAVDDVDRAQSVEGLMEALMKEATHKMALARDSYVASLAAGASYASASTQINTAAKAKAAVDSGLLALREKDVDIEDDVVIEISPFMYQLLRDNITEVKTDNAALIENGIIGRYDNCNVILTNNLYNDGTDDHCMVRTKRAIAFAGQIDKVEAFRPETLFADAIKGLNVFGAKIVRQKELYVLKVHK